MITLLQILALFLSFGGMVVSTLVGFPLGIYIFAILGGQVIGRLDLYERKLKRGRKSSS